MKTATLTISASHGSKPIQVLKNHIGPFVPAVDDPDSKEGRVLEFEDYNFDGYMDLKILSDDESPHNSNYDYLFFDSQSFQFVPNDTLAGILRGMIKFDKANKRITSGGVCCFGREYSWGTYTFVNGHYILIERDSQESIPSKNEKELFSIHKLERLINGRMTIVRVDTLR